MSNWEDNLLNSPLPYLLASDARLSQPDYTNDQTWELDLKRGNPPAISLQTTYGLRARRMRIFLRFIQGAQSLCNPLEFYQPPQLEKYLPSYLSLRCQPFAGIETRLEFWIPESQAATGRISINNIANKPVLLRLELACEFSSIDGSGSLEVVSQNGTPPFLKGQATNLSPILIISGNAEGCHSPFPTLTQAWNLLPGQKRSLLWASAALKGQQASFELAQRTLRRSWEPEVARMEMTHHSGQMEIITGSQEWNAIFSATQNMAIHFLLGIKPGQPAFVLSRNPEQGFSPKGDGSDYSSPWLVQTLWDARVLFDLVLPGEADYCKASLQGWISHWLQEDQNWSGQKTFVPVLQPLLAGLVWKVDQYTDDHNWLKELFPALCTLYERWFSPTQDHDQDGYPEWLSAIQSSLPEDRSHPPYSLSECPSMLAMLDAECASLIKIARFLGSDEIVQKFSQRQEELRVHLENSWNPKAKMYQYRDYASHLTSSRKSLKKVKKGGLFDLPLQFPTAQRMGICLKEAIPGKVKIRISGLFQGAEVVETLEIQEQTYTSQLFSEVKEFLVEDLPLKNQLELFSPSFMEQDISLFLPLWARMVPSERAKTMAEKVLRKQWLKPNGLPVAPGQDIVHIPWNVRVAEGLCYYGCREAAEEIFYSIMKGVTQALGKVNCFSEMHAAETGEISGSKNHLHGLAPIGLFLEILGVQYVKENYVVVRGNNPFPWPVTIKYRGMTITRHSHETVIIFSTGQRVTVDDIGPHEISLESI